MFHSLGGYEKPSVERRRAFILFHDFGSSDRKGRIANFSVVS